MQGESSLVSDATHSVVSSEREQSVYLQQQLPHHQPHHGNHSLSVSPLPHSCVTTVIIFSPQQFAHLPRDLCAGTILTTLDICVDSGCSEGKANTDGVIITVVLLHAHYIAWLLISLHTTHTLVTSPNMSPHSTFLGKLPRLPLWVHLIHLPKWFSWSPASWWSPRSGQRSRFCPT